MMVQVHPPFPFSYRDLGEGKERKGKERKEIDEILFFTDRRRIDAGWKSGVPKVHMY